MTVQQNNLEIERAERTKEEREPDLPEKNRGNYSCLKGGGVCLVASFLLGTLKLQFLLRFLNKCIHITHIRMLDTPFQMIQ